MLPRVITLDVASVDGRVDWFDPDLDLYYGLAAEWGVDAHLVGSATLAPEATAAAPAAAAARETVAGSEADADEGALLVALDSRGQVRNWDSLLEGSYWRGGVAVCTERTPDDHREYLDEAGVDQIVAGEDEIDVRAALDALADRYDVTSLIAGGDTVNSTLLRRGLVDEVNVLVHPHLVGGTSTRSLLGGPDPESPADVTDLSLLHADRVRDDVVWLRYEVEDGT